MLSKKDQLLKRLFDVIVSALLLLLLSIPIFFLIVISSVDTQKFGLLKQERVGLNANLFFIFKIRTMKAVDGINTFVTVNNDPRITRLGSFLRKTKLDELPQLYNVLIGDMSLVGPRPDVKGFADELKGENRIILSVRPGLTGPASIYFKNEEYILAEQEAPEEYNKRVIWPKKVELNKAYLENYKLSLDIKYLIKTLF